LTEQGVATAGRGHQGKAYINGTGHAPSAPPPSHFDLDKSKVSMSPRMFWGIVAGSISTAVIIGGMIVNTNWRIGGVEQGIADLRVELQEDRAATQTRQQAYIDCLEIERSNKNFTCPLAKTARAPEPVPVAKRKAVAKKTETTGWSLFPATAGQK
jgi:hypothetical protein